MPRAQMHAAGLRDGRLETPAEARWYHWLLQMSNHTETALVVRQDTSWKPRKADP